MKKCIDCQHYCSAVRGRFSRQAKCEYVEYNQFNGLVTYEGELTDNDNGDCKNHVEVKRVVKSLFKRLFSMKEKHEPNKTVRRTNCT